MAEAAGSTSAAPPVPATSATGQLGEMGNKYLGTGTMNAMAGLGRVQLVIGALVSILIGLLLIWFGYEMAVDPRTSQVQGTVTASALTQTPGTPQKTVSYNITAKYQVQGQAFTATGSLSSNYAVGAALPVWYNPAQPSSNSLTSPKRLLGAGLVVGGLILGIGGPLTQYYMSQSKTAEAALGMSSIARAII